MDLVNNILEWTDKVSGLLSIVSAFLAGWAALGVRRLNRGWGNLVRIQDLKTELTTAASNISAAAPNFAIDREVVLDYFSDAEAILVSLKASIGGKFIFWSTRRELILEIEKVRVTLRKYQGEKKDLLDNAMISEIYRQISQVALRVEHYIDDRRLRR